jgi:hypothetical protein
MDPAAEYLPAPHSWHALTPAVSEYFPAAQSVQVLFEEAPLGAECVPAAQAVQVVGPGISESSSAHSPSMGAMPWASDIAFSFLLPEHAHVPR